jgi:transposase-like protein
MARKNQLKDAAIRMSEAGIPTWKIAQQLKVSESTVVKWVRK